MKKVAAKPDDQFKAFRKAAREIGADASSEGFQNVLRKIAKAKPSSEKRKTGSRRS